MEQNIADLGQSLPKALPLLTHARATWLFSKTPEYLFQQTLLRGAETMRGTHTRIEQQDKD